MKKIFLVILFAFAFSFGYAQFTINQTIGSSKTLVTALGGLKSDSALILPTFSDTTAANRSQYVKFYAGNMIRVADTVFIRNSTATKWVAVGTKSETPNLQQVTDKGDTTTNDIFINSLGLYDEDFEEYANISSSNGKFTFTPCLTSSYKTFIFTSSALSAARTYTLPNASGTIPLTVNGQSANSSGDITITIPTPATPTLQEVTTAGNTTDKNIYSTKNTGSTQIGVYGSYGAAGAYQSTTKSYLYVSKGVNEGDINADSLTASRIFQLPNASGTIALKSQVVDSIYRTPGKDSIYFTKNGNTYAIKDSTGSSTGGTVTSVATGYGLSGGTITTSGTLIVDSATLSNKYVRISDTASMLSPYLRKIDTTNKWVNNITRTAGKDSIIYYIGSTRYAIKDSIGTNPDPVGYYGAWQDAVTQTAAADNVGYPMIFRTVDLENQVRVVTNGTNLTRITFDNTGIYNLQFSSQFQNTSNQLQDVTIWLRKNGVDVPGSSGYISVPNSHGGVDGHIVVGWNYLLSIVGGEYYEIVWSTTLHTAVTMQFYAAGNPPPSTASVIATVTQQSGIMAGTGITAINSLTKSVQTLVTGTSGTDFNISSSDSIHTFNLPTASATNRGALSSANWSTFNSKIGAGDTASMLTNYINSVNYGLSKSSQTVSADTTKLSTLYQTNLRLKISDTAAMLSPYTRQKDTIPMFVFGAGSGATGDTAAFSTSAIYGAFYNDFSDTIVVTSFRIGLQGTSPSINATIYFNDSLAVTAGATKIVNAGNTATNIYTGTSVTSLDNTKIPPGNWVWVQTGTVTTKPTFFILTLFGYKSRR